MATRQEICDALKDQLSAIRVANGYATDIGQQVIEWSALLVEPKTSCIVFGDTDESYEDENARLKCKLSVEIQATVFTSDYGTDARKALTDLLRCIYKRKSLGLKRVTVDVKENSIDTDDGGRDLVFVYLKTEITYYDEII